MRTRTRLALLTASIAGAVLLTVAALAQNQFPTPNGSGTAPGAVQMVVRADGQAVPDNSLATYSVGANNLVPAATARELFVVPGSATKTIRIRRIAVSAEATAIGGLRANVSRCSASPTAGATVVNFTVSPHDSTDGAATIQPWYYGSANPTTPATCSASWLGIYLTFVAANTNQDRFVYETGLRNEKAITLRGTSDFLIFSFAGAAVPAGGVVHIENIKWTEE